MAVLIRLLQNPDSPQPALGSLSGSIHPLTYWLSFEPIGWCGLLGEGVTSRAYLLLRP